MSSVSFKIQILKHQQNKDKNYPVNIRVGWKSVYSYINTGLFISKNDLTKDFSVKNSNIIDRCNLLIKKYRDAIHNIEDLSQLSVKEIVEIITSIKKEKKEIDFMQFCIDLVESMKSNSNEYDVTLKGVRMVPELGIFLKEED